MTQIKDEFTLEAFRKALEALALSRPPQRERVLYTGKEGMENIHYVFEISNAREQVVFLKEKKAIMEEEAQRLEDMISSKDRENFELAKYIIAQKSLPFLQTKQIEKCLYNSKPAITVTQAPIL
jgi:hypothetical protein